MDARRDARRPSRRPANPVVRSTTTAVPDINRAGPGRSPQFLTSLVTITGQDLTWRPTRGAAAGCGKMVVVVEPAAVTCGLASPFPATSPDRGFDPWRPLQCPSQTPPEEAHRQHLQAQAVVEQAKKLLMTRFDCGPEMAFELLRGASQYANVKVHVVEERLTGQPSDNDQENLG